MRTCFFGYWIWKHRGDKDGREMQLEIGVRCRSYLSVVGGRWKPILTCLLLGGRKRFSKLCRLAPNATERMITLQL